MADMGRPTRLDEIHEYNPQTGAPITVGDAIIRYVRGGNYLETACNLVQVDNVVMRGWLREGARAHRQVLEGTAPSRLRKAQRLARNFSLSIRSALAEAEARDLQLLARLALGGIPQTTTTEKVEARRNAAGNIIRGPDGEPIYDVTERSVKTTQTLPDRQAIQWRMERRFPNRWGRHDRIDIDLNGGADLDELDLGTDPVDEINDALIALHRRKTEALTQLSAAGVTEDQIIDVDVIDEADQRPPDPGDQPT